MTFLMNVNKFRFNLHNTVICPFSIYLKNILFITFLDVKQLNKNIWYIMTIFKFHNIFYINLFHLFNIVIYLTAVLYGIEVSTFFVQFQCWLYVIWTLNNFIRTQSLSNPKDRQLLCRMFVLFSLSDRIEDNLC